ncbi:hypothetical protein AGOR_G00231940 [Albula goreensis]|uniref:Neuronal cell adhesion molecule n=1 Tax=Albula goreensis TaxID=1534307 RepID=A0A8T3CFX6_9TELE|nr:hypothetical protein AGOR_G00231940 [Albula goreensis]
MPLTSPPTPYVPRLRQPCWGAPTQLPGPVWLQEHQAGPERETLELECIAEGLPTPQISWSKESGKLPEDRTSLDGFQKKLKIMEVTEADGGDYRCTARNNLGSIHHIITVVVKAAPYWRKTPKNLILAPQESGVLSCQVNGDPKPIITWSMNGVPIENTPKDPSRSIDEDTITFSNVQPGASAVYQCNASNEYGYVLANTFVNVLSEPPRVLTSPNQVYQVIRENPAFLDCAAFGSPIPTITWFKEGHATALAGDPLVLHENGTLEIPSAQSLDSGRYTCRANNSLGVKDNHVFLEVKEPTRILKQSDYKMVQRHSNAVFECRVTHDPSLIPTVTWLKDSGELPDDERFVVDSDSLTINDVTEEDEGAYTCIMNTTLDQDSASAVLTVVEATPTPAIVYEKPDPPTDLELTDQQPRSVQLTWTPGDEHNSPIQKFIIQYEDGLHHPGVWHNLTEVPGTKTTAHLKLSPFVLYAFRVVAGNAMGHSQPSIPSRQYQPRLQPQKKTPLV